MIHAFAVPLPSGSLLIRAGPKAKYYGCEYLLSCVIVPQGRKAILNGLVDNNKTYNKHYMEALKNLLVPLGFTEIEYERRKPGQKPRTVTFKIRSTDSHT